MKILLVGNYSADGQYSMQGFSGILLSGLRERGLEVRRIAPGPRLSRMPFAPGGTRKWLGYVDKYALFPPELRRAAAWADLVHICDQGNGIYLNSLHDAAHLVTCHDLLAIRSAQGELPEWRTGRTGQVYQRLILNGLRKARHMVCVSQATREDALRLTGLPPECIGLIRNGLYQSFAPLPASSSEPLLTALGLPPDSRYLLHVGGNQPYKNRPMTVEIFAALHRRPGINNWKLVLAGKPITPAMRDAISRHGLTEAVIDRSGVDHLTLQALYSQAAGLVFPSLYEGFGLPILEAQACGCPVFTSNRAPMTEVGGEAAVYFDPARPEEAADVIAAGLSAPARSRMSAAGTENAARFTQERMISEYVQAYERILDGSFCTAAP